MALVIEDGTVVAGANTYISIAAARDYASARGITLGTDAEVESQLHAAMAYLEAQSYKGVPTEPDEQSLAWPRTGVRYDCREIGANTIPQRLKDAEAQLVIEQFNGVIIWSSTTSSSGKFVKRQKVDVLEVEYATPQEMGDGGSAAVADMPAVDALLAPLLRRAQPLLAYRI